MKNIPFRLAFGLRNFPLSVIIVTSQFLLSASSKLSPGIANTLLPPDCGNAKIQEVKQQATESIPSVEIDCNLSLTSNDVITKNLVFVGERANGITVNGNGATINGGKGTQADGKYDMIVVKSRLSDNGRTWQRPENIIIKNINIVGSVSISGMSVHDASREPGYVEKARNSAPKNITLDNVTITGVSRTPIYVSPGVPYFSLLNSEINGKSNSVAMYLDAETYGNTIKHNKIQASTSREVIAIDGSSYNKIISNWFSGLNNGGIYLYRNCGERGTIRHSTPSHNYIVNNIFYYKNYTGPKPAIYLGSRNGNDAGHSFCDKDKGYPYGSSVSDLDYARYNVVMQNQFFKRAVNEMITGRNPSLNSPNYVDYNKTVAIATLQPAGCYVSANGYQKDFILHGETIEVLDVGNGPPASYNYTCNDGQLTRTTQNSQVTRLVFDCRTDSNNEGCQKTISCPFGQKIIGATAAVNLEHGLITEAMLGNVPTNRIRVIVPSDKVSDGTGYVGNTILQDDQKIITGIDGLSSVSIGCKEHDANGGDCHIKVVLYCR